MPYKSARRADWATSNSLIPVRFCSEESSLMDNKTSQRECHSLYKFASANLRKARTVDTKLVKQGNTCRLPSCYHAVSMETARHLTSDADKTEIALRLERFGVPIKITVSWDVTPWSLVDFEGICYLCLQDRRVDFEDVSNTFIWNVGTLLPDYKASHFRLL
jgi:hypothetical protein